MKWMKALLFLLLSCIIIIVWLFALYLRSLEQLDEARKPGEMLKQAQSSEAAQTELNEDLLYTVQQFCQELYSASGDQSRLNKYLTKQGKETFVALGDEDAELAADVKTTVHHVAIYTGVVQEKTAEVIVAVKRTITIKETTSTTISYVKLELTKADSWLINEGEVLGELLINS